MKLRSILVQVIVVMGLFSSSFAPAQPAHDHMLPLPPLSAAQILERPAPEWHTSTAALAIIRHAEQLRLKSYSLAGQWLIGYGHAGDTVEGMEITPAKAEAYLEADIKSCEVAVADAVAVPVTRNEFSALVALCYNIGNANMAKSSVVRRLNRQDRQGAADAFLLWTHATIDDVHQVCASLVDRRRKERALFLVDRAPLDQIPVLLKSS